MSAGIARVEVVLEGGEDGGALRVHALAVLAHRVLAGEPEGVAGRRHDPLLWVREQRVDLLGPDPGGLAQAAARPAAAEDDVRLVDDPGEVGEDERAAALHERHEPLGDPRLQHEEHRGHDELVAVEGREALDHVHADPSFQNGR